MKTLLFLLSFALISIGVQAQTVPYNGKLTGVTQDTVTNAGVDTLTMTCKGHKTAVTFQYNITKISGTVGGTIKVYGSIDGSKYRELNSYTITDATAVGGYSMSSNGYSSYRVIVTGTGTQVSAYEIWALHR